MKKIAVLCASICVLLSSYSRVAAISDPFAVPNNKFGIHILSPDEVGRVAEIVNNNGGDWGYVTVPIQPSDRDQDKWQAFMHACRDRHLIPIVRITTIPLGGTWEKGSDTDLVDFANFLAELDWPVKNRYIVLFNEVNRDTEWGGQVDPAAYTRIVKNAYAIFKARSEDFFMLGPALDDALPNSSTSLSSAAYLSAMQKEDSSVWSFFDGWAAHSYPNPGFAAPPGRTGWMSLTSYQTAMKYLNLAPKPVFITETGWDQNKVSASKVDAYWRQAFTLWQKDTSVVAVTPFVLQGGEQFAEFSLYNTSGELNQSGITIKDLAKVGGSPDLAGPQPTPTPKSITDLSHTNSSSGSSFQASSAALRIENFFRSLFGLRRKAMVVVGPTVIQAEMAVNAKEWEQGLSGKPSLGQGAGMLFLFPQFHTPLFWMKDMNFPIDIIWIREDKIVDITPDVPVSRDGRLPTYSPRESVDKVLEVPAGYTAQKSIVVGDTVNINY